MKHSQDGHLARLPLYRVRVKFRFFSGTGVSARANLGKQCLARTGTEARATEKTVNPNGVYRFSLPFHLPPTTFHLPPSTFHIPLKYSGELITAMVRK
jgi:hypothetical protein